MRRLLGLLAASLMLLGLQAVAPAYAQQAIQNPNNGSYCLVGNSGCPGLPVLSSPGGSPMSATNPDFVTQIPVAAASSSTTAVQCATACASLLVSGAHNLYGAGFSSTATGWLLLEDATSCAANGTVTPLRAYAYPTAGVTTTLSWGDIPRSVATGIALCFSTTGPYTATTSTTAFIWADYK